MNRPPSRGKPGSPGLRALLRAYPGGFRTRYQAEILEFLEALREEPRFRARWIGPLRFWLEAGFDAARTGMALRLGRRRGRPRMGDDTDGRMTMDGWRSDLRLATRSLGRSPGFTALVVLTLTAGIGAATSIFTVVDATLLRPLPFAEPQELAVVWQTDRATGTMREAASTADYWDFVERSRSFRDLAMTTRATRTLTGPDREPLRLSLALVTANTVDVLGVAPRLGRGFAPQEDRPGGPVTALVTEIFWRDALGADPDVVGRTLSLDGEPVEVVGVLPPATDVLLPGVDAWLPLQSTPATAARNPHSYRVLGRLAEGRSVDAAHREMVGIAAELEAEFPANQNRGAFVEPLDDVLRGDVRPTLWVLFGAVGLLLVIACTNVATLLLARATGHRRDVAVLAALGAGPRRLTRRFLLEGLLLAGGGAALGALAALATPMMMGLLPGGLPTVDAVAVDGTALAFAAGVASTAGLAFALIPILLARSTDLRAALAEGGREGGGGDSGPRRLALRRALVGAQLALSVLLLVGSALMGRTLWNLQRVDPGFQPDDLLRVSYFLPEARYPRDFATWPDWPEVNGFHHRLLDRMEATPGVASAAISTNHPLDPGFTNSFSVAGRPSDPDQGEMTTRIVSPGYFETAGIGLVEGRFMHAGDDSDTPFVAILNRTAAQRYFPDGDALGARIGIWGTEPREVVGIVEDERMFGLDRDPPPALYVNAFQAPPLATPIVLLVRSVGPPLALAEPVRRIVRELDPQVPVFEVSTMEETVAASVARERFTSAVLAVFAAVAVALALLGVHGVLAYLVAQRRHEVGVRMALGASRGRVLRMILGQGAVMAGLGIAAGLGAAWLLSGVLESLLFGVSPTEPALYGAVAGGVGVVAALAAAVPAVRATRTDPARSLRAS